MARGERGISWEGGGIFGERDSEGRESYTSARREEKKRGENEANGNGRHKRQEAPP